MYLFEDYDKKDTQAQEKLMTKVEFAMACLDNEHNEFDNFIIALFYCQERNNGLMSHSNFCRFLTDYEKATIEYKDKESINFTKFRSLITASLKKYCAIENVSTLIKLTIYASVCSTLGEILDFCKLRPAEYDIPF